MPLTHSSISILKVGNYLQTPNEIMKNQGGKKQIQIQKFESRELIPYIADLTGLFIFSGFNNMAVG